MNKKVQTVLAIGRLLNSEAITDNMAFIEVLEKVLLRRSSKESFEVFISGKESYFKLSWPVFNQLDPYFIYPSSKFKFYIRDREVIHLLDLVLLKVNALDNLEPLIDILKIISDE